MLSEINKKMAITITNFLGFYYICSLKCVTIYIQYNYCIHDLRNVGVHGYIYGYGINCIIWLYR